MERVIYLDGKKMISIDIGSRNVHIVEGRFQKGQVEVSKCCFSPIPSNSLVNGEIENTDALGVLIKSLLAKNHIKPGYAAITIQNTQIITRDLVLPATKPSYLKNIIALEMEQFIPVGSKEHIYEYRIIQEITEEDQKKFLVRGAAIPKNIVDNYYNMLLKAGLKPVAMDMHSNCISKLFEKNFSAVEIKIEDPKKTVLIDAGYSGTLINIISNGRIDFSRNISLGGKDAESLIASTFNISIEKAEQKKLQELNLDGYNVYGEAESASNETTKAIEPFLRAWTGEIQKVIQYFGSRSDKDNIQKVYVYGGNANIKGLTSYIGRIFNTSAQLLDSLDKVKVIGKGCSDFHMFINAFGCLVRYWGEDN